MTATTPPACSWDCAMAIIGVGLLWGATNPLLRLGSKSTPQTIGRDAQNHSVFRRLLAPLFDLTALFMNWRFSVPFVVNQSASILFIVLVSRYPVSIVIPCVNALQFVFTAVVGHLIGERMLDRRRCMGAFAVTVGALMMMTSDALNAG